MEVCESPQTIVAQAGLFHIQDQQRGQYIFCAQAPNRIYHAHSHFFRVLQADFLIQDQLQVNVDFLWVYYDQLLQSSFRINAETFLLGQEKLQDS